MGTDKLHYAWIIAGTSALLYFFCNGLAVGCFSPFLPYIRDTFGFTNTQLSSVLTVRSLTALLCNFVVLKVIERFNIRATTGFACCLTGLSFLLYARAKTLPAFYIAAITAGLSYGLVGSVSTSILIRRWFRDRLGVALSICASGAGIAAFIMPSLITCLVLRYGLMVSFYSMGVLSFLAAGLIITLLRNDPTDIGLEAYTLSRNHVRAMLSSEKKVVLSAPLYAPLQRQKTLYLVPFFLGAFAINCQSFFMMFFTERGFGGVEAATAISVYGLMLLIGKLSYGFLSDARGHRKTSLLFLLLTFLGVVLCCFISCSPLLMYLGSGLAGAGVATGSVGIPIWVGDFSTPTDYSKEIKRFQLLFAGGGLAFSIMPGIIADRLGSYMFVNYVYIFFFTVIIREIAGAYRHIK